MKLSRLAGLIFLVALAVNLVAVSGASAAAPEFHPGTLALFTGESGPGVLQAGSLAAVECKNDLVHGFITGPKTIGGVVVTFHGCVSTENKGCPVKSPGLPTPEEGGGLIVTHLLKGELGSVKTAQAASGVGLLTEPETGTEFVTLEGTCLLTSPAPVQGSVTGEVTPLNTTSKDGKVIFIGTGDKQKITEVNVLGTVKKPKLEALGLLESSETTTELALYIEAIVVT